MNVISINRKSSTDEYAVSERVNGRVIPGRTYYTDFPSDAADTAIAKVEAARARGEEADLSKAEATMVVVSHYRPDWLIAQVRKTVKSLYPEQHGTETFIH